jgi:hypothetical protein
MNVPSTPAEATVWAAMIAFGSAVAVAILSAWIARVFVGRDRRRQMYGEAFRAAMEWKEMLYRVRRRDNTMENDRDIINRFHDLQQRIDYYEGWIGSESRYMRRSFTKLVKAAKAATQNEIRRAWDKRGKSGNADLRDVHPSVDPAIQDQYLSDVRAHLSIQPWRWLAVWWRNP